MNAFVSKLTLLVLIVFVSSTQITNAQTNISDSYKQTLIQLIELLQKQIVLLQAELASRTNDDDLLYQQVQTTAVYKVSSQADISKIKNHSHRKYFEQLYEMWPRAYTEKLVTLEVFDDSNSNFDVFVETVPGQAGAWRYGVHKDLVGEPSSEDNLELMVHELAHMLAYELPLNHDGYKETTCHDYYEKYGCPTTGSYLYEFAERFWTDVDLNRAQSLDNGYLSESDLFSYYERHKSEYVSDYAASSPEEDFAETFLFFVLDWSVDGREVEDKIRLLTSYQHLKDIKLEVLSAIY